MAALYGDPDKKVTSFWCMGMNQHTRGTWINNLVYNIHLLTGKISTPGNSPFSLTGQPSACGTVREVGTLTLAFNPGKNNPKYLVPACIFLFLGIWIEKGIGLIVQGLVPSPMGEVVDYAPSWVEVCVTLGILAIGIFVVTMLLKPALKIEQRFESSNRSQTG